jgi:hypothetical protein
MCVSNFSQTISRVFELVEPPESKVEGLEEVDNFHFWRNSSFHLNFGGI